MYVSSVYILRSGVYGRAEQTRAERTATFNAGDGNTDSYSGSLARHPFYNNFENAGRYSQLLTVSASGGGSRASATTTVVTAGCPQ